MSISTDIAPALLSWTMPSSLDTAIARVSNCYSKTNGMHGLVGVSFSSLQQLINALRESMFAVTHEIILDSPWATTASLEVLDSKVETKWTLLVNTFKDPNNEVEQLTIVINCSESKH